MDEYKHLFQHYLAYYTRYDGTRIPLGKDNDIFLLIYGTGEFECLPKSEVPWSDGKVEDYAYEPNPFMDYMQLKILAYCNITKFLKEDSYELKEEFLEKKYTD
jgi:hypothetical protein